MSGAELITRRRKWSPTQKAALLEEVEDEGGKVAVVARRHGISESLLYNWRSAWPLSQGALEHWYEANGIPRDYSGANIK